MNPPCRLMAALAAAWKGRTMTGKSSGSSDVASDVEPARSQNMTVTWRRSGTGSARRAPAGPASRPRSAPVKDLPHPPQNFAVGWLEKVQSGQVTGSDAPQLPQKRAPASFFTPHFGQFMFLLPPRRQVSQPYLRILSAK